jgi:uncharacterized zinc-type alcohol dehydrogenase-like protein
MGNHGGFQAVLRVPADFAFTIPDGLDSAHAAPLLCAGITGERCFSRVLCQLSPACSRLVPSIHCSPLSTLPAVFAPLRKWLTRPGMHVGVVGVGGLGHLAVQVRTHVPACALRFVTFCASFLIIHGRMSKTLVCVCVGGGGGGWPWPMNEGGVVQQ